MAGSARFSTSGHTTNRGGLVTGHIDLDAVEADTAHDDGTLGPEAAQWAQSLLEGARFELARADDKANTLFRFYGVVGALSIGLLAGNSASPTHMDGTALCLAAVVINVIDTRARGRRFSVSGGRADHPA